jgi:Leucine-rich repeat (LRR) protein
LRKRIASARTDGRLNIAALGLTEIPREVLNMYNAGVGDGAWYESVDLVRLIAADNEIEILQDGTFPDDNAASHSADDDYGGNLFGGLETLDFHGNHLKTLPIGLRRLERLTTLNLSANGLHNDCLGIISQIDCLRELRLAGNALEGTLGSQLCRLKNLEILDVRNNALTALPGNLDEITVLRALYVDGNLLALLPFDCLLSLPLTELSAARNRLSGPLFPSSIHGLSRLKVLDVANNALTSLAVNGDIELPALQSLNVTENRLAMLPDISGWTELMTLTVGGNKLSSFPEGITSLHKLKAVDFSRNDLRSVDERFGLMESLTALIVANNPLRERRFLRMDTEEMKRELRSRLLPAESIDVGDEDMVSFDGSDPVARRTTSAPKQWPIKTGGVLDRSSTNLETIERSDLEPLAAENDIKTLLLHHNLLQCIPPVTAVTGLSLTSLDMSNNKLSGVSYLPESLELPKLKSLDISANGIKSLFPLVDNLSTPELSELNVSRNRLTSLPRLRDTFPSLSFLIAYNNSIAELQVEAVRGLHVLDVSGNEIGHLEPKLGLLDAEGLRTLLVGGNRFRVPRRDVIEKGTGAVLTYLRSRIPDEEMQGLG